MSLIATSSETGVVKKKFKIEVGKCFYDCEAAAVSVEKPENTSE